MAITGNLHKLSWGGRFFDNEIWNCSLHVYGDQPNDATPDEFETLLKAFHESESLPMSSAAYLDYIKFNKLDPSTGRYADTGASLTHFIEEPVNGIGTPAPPQIALAVSLTTALARGRAHTGRFYTPVAMTSMNLDSSGRIGAASCVALLNNARSMINTINQFTEANVVVYSKIGQIVQPVTGVRVGRVIDSQRRRRSSLPEDYSVNTLTG